MGKGIHASMIMVMLRTVVRTMTPLSQSPSELLEKVNNALCKDMEKLRSFATLFCGMYDTQSHTFSYASAGHPNAILGKLNGQTEKLPHKGVAIGFLPNRVYKQFEVSMEQGDSIVICTDGILEAMNQDREQYGYEKLMKTIQTQLVQDVEIEQLIESLTQDVSVYRQGEQRDDVTIVIIRRT